MHIGIFGGSFNPPHTAHLVVAETVRDACGLDRVLWIPNRTPPHKADGGLAPAECRLEMVRLAVAGNPAFSVSDVELRREGYSYTVDTVRSLLEAHPDDTFSLIVGGDSLRDFGTWHRPDEIARLAELIVYRRPGGAEDVPEGFSGRVHFVDAPLLHVSSTYIRARLREGHSVRYLLPDPVRQYVAAHGLYM